jgi:predicted dinucleotide-binding enzyme
LDPVVEGQAAHVLLASDDRPAMGVVAGIAQSLGFEAQEAGALENARLLEALALLWIRLSFQAGLGPRVALRVLRP